MSASGLNIGRWTVDDDLLDEAALRQSTIVRVASPDDIRVVLGSGSRPELELNVAACLDDGITVQKRRGGGCAVLLDPGNIVISVARPLAGLGGVRTHFSVACRWLAASLAELGYPGVEQRGISDLALGRRKLGGSCIFRRKDLLYYTTTLLVAPRIDLIERYLAHPPREPDYRLGRAHGEFLVALSDLDSSATVSGLSRELRSRLTADGFDETVAAV